MWSKVLTVINTFLLAILIGAGVFGAQTYLAQQGLIKTQIEEFAKELKTLSEEQKEILENPVLQFDTGTGKTLKIEDGEISGYTDVEAYLIEEEVLIGTDKVKVGYINFVNSEDTQIEEYIDDYLEDVATVSGRAEFGKDSESYFISLGCSTEKGIENQDIMLSGTTLSALKKATEAKPVKTRIFVGPYADVSGEPEDEACNSIIKNLQVAA
jgi:hypothetical protein